MQQYYRKHVVYIIYLRLLNLMFVDIINQLANSGDLFDILLKFEGERVSNFSGTCARGSK